MFPSLLIGAPSLLPTMDVCARVCTVHVWVCVSACALEYEWVRGVTRLVFGPSIRLEWMGRHLMDKTFAFIQWLLEKEKDSTISWSHIIKPCHCTSHLTFVQITVRGPRCLKSNQEQVPEIRGSVTWQCLLFFGTFPDIRIHAVEHDGLTPLTML